MPLYDLVCPKCGHKIVFKDSMNSNERKKQMCEKCQEIMKQKFNHDHTIVMSKYSGIKDD